MDAVQLSRVCAVTTSFKFDSAFHPKKRVEECNKDHPRRLRRRPKGPRSYRVELLSTTTTVGDTKTESKAQASLLSSVATETTCVSRVTKENNNNQRVYNIVDGEDNVTGRCNQCVMSRRVMGKLAFSTVVLLFSMQLLLIMSSTVEAASPAAPVVPQVALSTTTTTTGPPLELDNSPHFDIYRVENHTVQLGGIAFLPCIIKNLGNKSVSWIRARDSHILTVDREIFIMDRRFSTIHRKDSATWTLQIKSVQASDAGKYECQISTEPKLSHFVFLTVIVPRVRIFGDRDIFVKSSSTVQLKCVISQSLSPPTYIEWTRNDDERLPSSFLGVSSAASYDKSRRMQTTPPEHIAEGTTMSTLSILNAKPSDSGKYACRPAQLESASVNLHVLESDLPALMQTSKGTTNLRVASKGAFQLILVTIVCMVMTSRQS